MSKKIKTLDQLKDSRMLYDKKLPAFGYMLVLAIAALLAAVVIWSIRTPKNYMITSSGTIQSTNKNYVMSPYTGEITYVVMSEGENVEKGDVLFTVKSTDLDLQGVQLNGQKKIYETQISQYQKLVKSIEDDTNYFDAASSDDSLYYNQYEEYKSQVAQQTADTSTYKAYGYTDEQIEAELVKNESKVTQIYYSTIKTVEASILESQSQLDSIQAQLDAVSSGQSAYVVTANATGKLHLMSDYKEGMVVQAAAAVASIASEQDEYLVQAYVSTSDAARVHIGDQTDIAISGLTQSVYGTISGEVTQIDSDVTVSQSEDSGSSSSYFKIMVKPDETYLLSKNGDKVNISNGMAVETRIQYDKVTYFNYVLEALGVLTR